VATLATTLGWFRGAEMRMDEREPSPFATLSAAAAPGSGRR